MHISSLHKIFSKENLVKEIIFVGLALFVASIYSVCFALWPTKTHFDQMALFKMGVSHSIIGSYFSVLYFRFLIWTLRKIKGNAIALRELKIFMWCVFLGSLLFLVNLLAGKIKHDFRNLVVLEETYFLGIYFCVGVIRLLIKIYVLIRSKIKKVGSIDERISIQIISCFLVLSLGTIVVVSLSSSLVKGVLLKIKIDQNRNNY